MSEEVMLAQEASAREFDASEMQRYADSNDFAYMKYQVRPPSIWERASWWIQRLIKELFSNPNTPWFTKLLYYLVLIGVLGGAIYYLIRIKYGKAILPEYQRFSKNEKNLAFTNPQDFGKLIDEAVSKGDYRLAIRYLFLQSLVRLADQGSIKLRDSKSPYDYVKDLSTGVESYKALARTYEYVWYGGFEAEEHTFQQAKLLSTQLEQKR
ncbi:MAG: DUF4129 domain-containing protein [Bacteroidota bacterium]